MNNLDLYLNAIPSIKEKIESYPLEINEGTHKVIAEYKIHAAKERNRSVNELLASYRSDMESIKTVLQAKAQNLTPTGENPNIAPLTEQVRNLKRILKYDNPYNEVFEKTKLAKICYDLDRVEQNNLTEINQILSYVVEKFRLSGVVLSAQDFDYSIYAREYMTVFFQVSGDANRSEELERTFNSLYWKCPMLLTHLKLSIRSLVKKHNKALSAYCTRHKKELLEQTSTTEETFREAYLQKKSQLTVMKRQDAYTLVESFKNKDENISDYLETNTNRNKKLDSFVVTGSFATLSEPEQEKYFQNMMELNRTLEEWMTIDHFRFILEDVKKRMEDAKNHKNDVKIKEKEIAKLEKNRAKIVKKYDWWNKVSKNKEKIENKQAARLVEIEELIQQLNTKYRELDDAKITSRAGACLDKSSTLYDAFDFAKSFYGYCKELIASQKDLSDTVNEEMDRFTKFILDSNHILTKNLNLAMSYDVKEKMKEKCTLLNIKIEDSNLEDLDTLKKDLDMIQKIYDLTTLGITLNDIEFICNVNDLK